MRVESRKTPWWLVACAFGVAAVIAGLGAYWASNNRAQSIAHAMTGGDAARAPSLIRRYGCNGCHTIAGGPAGDGQVGGRLEDMRRRVYVGGAVLNSPENMVRWIVAPQTFAPHSAMPATGITEAEARDVAAFLYAR